MADRSKPPSSAADPKENQAKAREELQQARADHARRKVEDRRNVLLGAFLADHVARNHKLRSYVEKHIYEFHTRERDRAFLRAWLDQLAGKTKPNE